MHEISPLVKKHGDRREYATVVPICS